MISGGDRAVPAASRSLGVALTALAEPARRHEPFAITARGWHGAATLSHMTRRAELDRLTKRWRLRHDARRPAPAERPPADPDREALASRAFPFTTVTPAAYVADHGPEMPAFTYDDVRYTDPDLDAWLLEVGRLLRERR